MAPVPVAGPNIAVASATMTGPGPTSVVTAVTRRVMPATIINPRRQRAGHYDHGNQRKSDLHGAMSSVGRWSDGGSGGSTSLVGRLAAGSGSLVVADPDGNRLGREGIDHLAGFHDR